MENKNLLVPIIDPSDFICLDAEFASNGKWHEMLELAIVNINADKLIDQRFKPRRLKKWGTEIHHILPDDVKDMPLFVNCQEQIQDLFNSCQYIIGFDVEENDLHQLELEGIVNLEYKTILEVRDWFWICYGEANGLDQVNGINLIKCCTTLGVEIDENLWHGAMYDTRMTLECFRRLLNMFIETEFNGTAPSFTEVLQHYRKKYDELKEKYEKGKSCAYCSIYKNPDGTFFFEVSRKEPVDKIHCKLLSKIFVENKEEALIHFSMLLTGQVMDRHFVFNKLKPKHLKEFENYSNTFNYETHNMETKLMKLARKYK